MTGDRQDDAEPLDGNHQEEGSQQRQAENPSPPDQGGQAPNQAIGSGDPRIFVLERELSEVHLLLDYVSANPAATVSELTSKEKLEAQGLDEQWIEKICMISCPPEGSRREKAEEAALLIRAKDYLNSLTRPASGSTIAFTHLVTQGSGRQRIPEVEDGESEAGHTPTRHALAATAYPDLVGKASSFRTRMQVICVGLLIALVMTCSLSWYVAYGNAVLAEFNAARDGLRVAHARVDEAERGPAPNRDNQGSQPVQQEQTVFVPYCDRPAEAQRVQSCRALSEARLTFGRAKVALVKWMCIGLLDDCDRRARDSGEIAEAPMRASALANILGSAVLPFLYGLLGAGAAVLRSLSHKTRESRLSPRDILLSIQQLALGAVVGACIGLFVAAPGAGETQDSLLGPVALSGSAISFVAGFGVEGVFQALEALIGRIFNVERTSTRGSPP